MNDLNVDAVADAAIAQLKAEVRRLRERVAEVEAERDLLRDGIRNHLGFHQRLYEEVDDLPDGAMFRRSIVAGRVLWSLLDTPQA